MQEDDLMPNDGSWVGGVPVEPKDQRLARTKERAATLKERNVLRELIDRFDERIAERDRISTIGVDINEKPEIHQKRCLVNAMISQELAKERQWLQELLEAHDKNI